MNLKRDVEIFGCILLLTFVAFLILRSPICQASKEGFARASESDVRAFLEGKTDNYKGFDYAGLQGY